LEIRNPLDNLIETFEGKTPFWSYRLKGKDNIKTDFKEITFGQYSPGPGYEQWRILLHTEFYNVQDLTN
jgi:hypothetical protein